MYSKPVSLTPAAVAPAVRNPQAPPVGDPRTAPGAVGRHGAMDRVIAELRGLGTDANRQGREAIFCAADTAPAAPIPWSQTARALRMTCAAQMPTEDADAFMALPQAEALATAGFSPATLVSMLRYFWGSQNIKREHLGKEATALVHSLEDVKAADCRGADDMARFNNTVRFALVEALDRTSPGFGMEYVDHLEENFGATYAHAQQNMRAYLFGMSDRFGATAGPAAAAAPAPASFATSPHQLQATIDRTPEEAMAALVAKVFPRNHAVALTEAMHAYIQVFQGHGDQFAALMDTVQVADWQKLLGSVHIYGDQPAALQNRLTYERDLANIGMRTDYRDHNPAVVGCDSSYFLSKHAKANGCLAPGRPTSNEMRTPLTNPAGAVAWVRLLNLAAPALDSSRQPEAGIYLGPLGGLKKTLYRSQIEALFGHLATAVQREAPPRVVLSAIGTGAFLAKLSNGDKAAARDIVGDALFKAVVDLRGQGIEVAFTDRNDQGPIWQRINERLAAQGQPPIAWVGGIPGDWARDDDLVVNAADNAGLTGNNGKLDNSIDGRIGAWSLAHPLHALMCKAHSLGCLH